jgi:hypothetical protein
MKDLQRKIQDTCEAGYWGSRVTKAAWPKANNTFVIHEKITGPPVTAEFGIREYAFHMKHTAIETGGIGPENERSLAENTKYLWETTFQREYHALIENRYVRQGYSDTNEPLPRRINFRGQQVLPFVSDGFRRVENPRYKRAAIQEVYFDPDTVHFLFPDPDKWAGEVVYREIPDAPPFFRIICRYAAKPVRPDLGLVVTVLPPGLKGTLWRWAWKLVGFVP